MAETSKQSLGASEMAQQMKGLAAKPSNLSLISRTHVMQVWD